LRLETIKKPTMVYEGLAVEACKLFPANVNVAAALSIAFGPEKTRVRIVVDPRIHRNIHEITVKGDFGELSTQIHNVPSLENSATSSLAALSAIATLKRLTEPIIVGT